MRVSNAHQVQKEQINWKHIDLVLCSSGFEARASYFASQTPIADFKWRFTLPFKGQKTLSRVTNDGIFSNLRFDFLREIDGDDIKSARNAFLHCLNVMKESGLQEASIAIDYSCMTRAWYGAFINCLFSISGLFSKLNVYFSYSPSTFSPPLETSPNDFVGPLPGFCILRPMDKPVALLIGLGYERVRAAGLREYVDPAETLLFYTDPAIDPQFSKAVFDNNKALIEFVKISNLIRHPLSDLDATTALLHDATSTLSKDYRVIVAPLGVKPFSLLSMLLSARYNEFDLWRVSGGGFAAPAQREACGELLIYQVCFTD